MRRLRESLRRVPGLPVARRMLRAASFARHSAFLTSYPPGTFYSPIPAEEDVPAAIDRSVVSIPGVDLREAEQVALLERLGRFSAEAPFRDGPVDGLRFHLDNEYYSYCDASVLYSMLRHFQPKRVVEVGSGFSSAVMLDTRDRFLDPETHFSFIDPHPERLHSLLRPGDHSRCTIFPSKVQDVGLGVFDALQTNDILFVDSSHVVKLGSDVAWILFEILPRLASGVVVHFHDIPWPFEYPLRWIRAGRAWNEAYVLRAFLQYSEAFRILFFNDFMLERHAEELRAHLPAAMQPGRYELTLSASSLWLVRS